MRRLSDRVWAVIKLVTVWTVSLTLAASVIGCSLGMAMVYLERSGPERAKAPAVEHRLSTGKSADHRDSPNPRAHPVIRRAVKKHLPRRVSLPPVDPEPDEMIVVSQASPEMVTLWRQGQVAFQTYCNTGVPGAGTPRGLYRIRRKLPSDNMRGYGLDGRPYIDPGVPWVMYFHGGDALHGFERSGYGWPQSLGCVELPIPAAWELYQQVYVGTRVLVLGSSGG